MGGPGDIILSGAISGGTGVTLTKVGNNTLTLNGVQDNTNLTLIVSGGTVILNKSVGTSVHATGASVTINSGGTIKIATGNSGQLPSTATVTVNAGGTLDLNGNTESFDQLAGAGTVTNSRASSTGTVTIGTNNGSNSFSGVITNGAGVTALTKTGTGTATLTGNSTYTGATTVSAGTIQLGANIGVGIASELAYYNFDGNTNDASGNGNNGTIVGTGPGFVPGQYGQALNLPNQSGGIQYRLRAIQRQFIRARHLQRLGLALLYGSTGLRLRDCGHARRGRKYV